VSDRRSGRNEPSDGPSNIDHPGASVEWVTPLDDRSNLTITHGRVYVAICPAGGERTSVGLCVGSP
jgi:hypothetical protein